MVIGQKHRYLFVDLPRTGSTAIRKELCLNYGGVPILHRHATLEEFHRIAAPEERSYFVFSGIRNPIDDAVSFYFKLLNDHKGQLSALLLKRDPIARIVNLWRTRRFRYVKDTGADFSAYFLRFHRLPYTNWSVLSHSQFDFVVRFDYLQDDFAEVLRRFQIKQLRPLPLANMTAGRGSDYLSHYSPEARERAKRVFGPFMKRWGYEFPPEWGASSDSRLVDLEFIFLNVLLGAYWRYLKPYATRRTLAATGRSIAKHTPNS